MSDIQDLIDNIDAPNGIAPSWCHCSGCDKNREILQGIKDLDAARQERIAKYEALLRTTVELLDDTDSLILEQLVIDIACALPPEHIIPLSELDDPEKIQSMIDNAKPDSEGREK